MAERLNRAAVVTRAAQLADEIGLEELTITKLARELGVTPPGIYRHVTDLADLRRAIGGLAAREAAAELATACAGLSGAAALTALAAALRGWAKRHPARYAALQEAPDPDDAEGSAAAEALIAVIATALRAYGLAGDDLTDAIRLIRSTLHGFIALEGGDGFKQRRSVEASFARIVAALDGVLVGWGAGQELL